MPLFLYRKRVTSAEIGRDSRGAQCADRPKLCVRFVRHGNPIPTRHAFRVTFMPQNKSAIFCSALLFCSNFSFLLIVCLWKANQTMKERSKCMGGLFGGCNDDNDCSWIIILVIILCCCCGNGGLGNLFGGCGGCGGHGDDCCDNNNDCTWIIILVVILCCCGNGGLGNLFGGCGKRCC